VNEQFFTEFRHVMDHLATFVDPIFVIGDVNIGLDRASDRHAITLVDSYMGSQIVSRQPRTSPVEFSMSSSLATTYHH